MAGWKNAAVMNIIPLQKNRMPMAQKPTDNESHIHEHAKLAPPAHTGRVAVIIVLIAAAFAGWGIVSRIHADHSLKTDTDKQAIPVVNVLKASASDKTQNAVVLPGNLHAWHEASIYARVNGYLKDWQKDIGDPVKAGDVLAEVETPEVDSQLQQAEADLNLAKANSKLSQTTAKRWKDLRKSEAVTQQDTDEKIADADAKAAAEQSAEANRDRLLETKNFKQLIAPFDGIVTARNTDVGALINEGSGSNPQELFHVATIDKLRVYVNIPENYRSMIAPDLVAELHFSEKPDQVFPARFLSTANAYDPSTRTVLVQFELDNPDGLFYPGSYTEAHLKNTTPQTQSIRLPVNAFVFKAGGLQIATVGADNKVTIKSVKVGRDYGNELEIVAGVAADDQVIINPPDSLYNGQEVRIAPKAKQDGGEEQQRAKDEDAKNDKDKDKDKSKSDQPQQKSGGNNEPINQTTPQTPDQTPNNSSGPKDVKVDPNANGTAK
jgi:RND family efflux transporter MFP subunit